jgi:thiaminase
MVTTEEPAEVLQHYKHFMTLTARYTARSLLALLVAMLPAAAIYLLLSVLNPSERRSNPLSPYLSDMEFSFFVAATVGSIAAAWWHRYRKAHTA